MSTSRVFGIVLVVAGLSAGTAHAVPSFARQTGMSCAQCHTVFPELTPFGRQFKANGYTMSTSRQITEGGDDKRVQLEFPMAVPLGAMALVGFTHTAKDQQVAADGPTAKNDDISLPQEFSLFYAGKIAPKLGAFIQLTYEGQGDHLGFDNTEIRFAHTVQVGEQEPGAGGDAEQQPHGVRPVEQHARLGRALHRFRQRAVALGRHADRGRPGAGRGGRRPVRLLQRLRRRVRRARRLSLLAARASRSPSTRAPAPPA